MCGIFGISRTAGSPLSPAAFQALVDTLFVLSESRGKEASGLAVQTAEEVAVLKKPYAASRLIRSEDYRRLIDRLTGPAVASAPLTLIGHSRLVTNGTEEDHHNNQPVSKAPVIGVHNGIIVNDDAIWSEFPALEREYAVDTEVFMALMAHHLRQGAGPAEGLAHTFHAIEGAASVALLLQNQDRLLLGTNHGSLYFYKTDHELVFASEELILKRLQARAPVFANGGHIQHIPPRTGRIYEAGLGNVQAFDFDSDLPHLDTPIPVRRPIHDLTTREPITDPFHHVAFDPHFAAPARFHEDYRRFEKAVNSLRRCTRCILPETMPFISFDAEGVCNYCRRHRKFDYPGHAALEAAVAPYRTGGSRPDCIVMLSGGRDSSYGLYYFKEVLGMNPVAYTYDWGMITDLARRNISRLCDQLQVEHILVSADIRRKRKNIQKNVLAWLKKPHLGTVPLFMAGDKHYFTIANQLSRDMGIEPIVSCRNLFEKTDFKTGFAGVYEGENYNIYGIPLIDKLRITAFYVGRFLSNPAYLNTSLYDTFTGYLSSYFGRQDYLYLYEYIPWDEQEISTTLRDRFDWETASDTSATWRIGDGTAAFYNYIYYVGGGFSEHDTFLSNRIREGMAEREEALRLAQERNQPRYESIKWYCDIVGIDFARTVRTIHAMSKRYEC